MLSNSLASGPITCTSHQASRLHDSWTALMSIVIQELASLSACDCCSGRPRGLKVLPKYWQGVRHSITVIPQTCANWRNFLPASHFKKPLGRDESLKSGSEGRLPDMGLACRGDTAGAGCCATGHGAGGRAGQCHLQAGPERGRASPGTGWPVCSAGGKTSHH